MEFWGVEVKNDASLSVDPGEDMIVHISLVALGENKNNGNEPVQLYLKSGDQKLLIGTLSHNKFPQLCTDIMLEKRFELSHSWKNGSVFFSGYKVDASDPEADDRTDDELVVASDKEPAVAKSGVKQVNFQLPNEDVKAKQEDDDDDSDEESGDESDDDMPSSEESGDEEEKKITAEVDSEDDDMPSSEESGDEEEKKVAAEADSDDDDDEDDSSDDDDEDDSSEDDTPEKPEESKKRAAEATISKNSTSTKKAKFITPQKTETKKPHVHIATPHPSKQIMKKSGSNGEASKTPKSAGAFGCKSCNRTFTSEMGMQSHTKAKHSAAA